MAYGQIPDDLGRKKIVIEHKLDSVILNSDIMNIAYYTLSK